MDIQVPGIAGGMYNMSDLQGLLGQFQPSPEDKKRALLQALSMAGFGLMGAPRGQEGAYLGRAGLLGMQGYQNALQNSVKDRQANLAQAAQLSELLRKSKFADELMGGGAAPSAPAPSMPTSMPQGAVASPNMAAPTPQAPAPQPAQGGIVAQLRAMGVPDVAIKTAAMSSDPAGAIAALVKEYSQPVFGQGKIPMVRTAEGFKAAPAAGYNDALAAQEAAVTGATERAKQPFTLQSLQLPGGGTQQLYGDQMQQLLRGNNGMPAPGKEGLAGQAPSPAQQGQDTEVAKGFGSDYLGLVKGEASAPANIAKYNRLKDLYSQIETGKLAPTTMTLKSIAAYIAPDLAKNWTKDLPYAQAAQSLSNAMALELRNPAGGAGMPGSLSDADRQYLQSMISGIQNDPRAIPLMLDAKIALEQRAKDLGGLARQYRKQNGKIDEGFYQVAQDYADAHPLFKGTPQQGPAASAPAGVARKVVKQGTYNGKRVVMYDDGTVDYSQ